MSCDGNYRAFCQKIGVEPQVAAAFPDAAKALEDIHEIARRAAPKPGASPLQDSMVEAKTVALFRLMQGSYQLTPPSHSLRVVAGVALPKHDAMYGYALVWDTIQAAMESRELPPVAAQVRERQAAEREARKLSTGTPLVAPGEHTPEQRLARTTVGDFAPQVLHYANQAYFDPDVLHTVAKQVAAQQSLPLPLRRRALDVVREFSTHGTLREPDRRKLGAAFASELASTMGADQCSRCGRYMADDGGHPCPHRNLLDDEAMEMSLGFWADGQIDPLDEEQRRRVKLAARALAASPGANRELRHWASRLADSESAPDADTEVMHGFARALFAVEVKARQQEGAAARSNASSVVEAPASGPVEQVLTNLAVSTQERPRLAARLAEFQAAGGDLNALPALSRGIETRMRSEVPEEAVKGRALVEAMEWGTMSRLLRAAYGQDASPEEAVRAARTMIAMGGAGALGVRPGAEHCPQCGRFMPHEGNGVHTCNAVDMATLPLIAGAVAEGQAFLTASGFNLSSLPANDLRAQALWLFNRIHDELGEDVAGVNDTFMRLGTAIELGLPQPVRVAVVAGNLDALLEGVAPTAAQIALLRGAAQAIIDAPAGNFEVELKRAARRYLSGVHSSDFVLPLLGVGGSLRSPELLREAGLDVGLVRAEATDGLEATGMVQPGRVTSAAQIVPGQSLWLRDGAGTWRPTTVAYLDRGMTDDGTLAPLLVVESGERVPFDPERMRLSDPTNLLAAPPQAPSSFTEQAPHGLPNSVAQVVYGRFGAVLRAVYDADTGDWNNPGDSDLQTLRELAEAVANDPLMANDQFLMSRFGGLVKVAYAYRNGFRSGEQWNPELQQKLGTALAEELIGGLGLNPGPDHCAKCGQFLPREGLSGHTCKDSDIDELARLQQTAARGRAFLLREQPEPLPAIADDRLMSGSLREQVVGLLDYVVDSYESGDPARLDPLRRELEDGLDGPERAQLRDALDMVAAGILIPDSPEMRRLVEYARSTQADPDANDDQGRYRQFLGAHQAYQEALSEWYASRDDEDTAERLRSREAFLKLAASNLSSPSRGERPWVPSADEAAGIVAEWLGSGSVGVGEIDLAAGVLYGRLGTYEPTKPGLRRLMGALGAATLGRGPGDPLRDETPDEVFEAMREALVETGTPVPPAPPREPEEPAGLISMEESFELQGALREILEGSGVADDTAFDATLDRIRDRLPDEADAYGAFDRIAGAMREIRAQAIRDGLNGLDTTEYTDTMASLINAMEGVPALARAVRGETQPGDNAAILDVAAAVAQESNFALFDLETRQAAEALRFAVAQPSRPGETPVLPIFREEFGRQMSETTGSWQFSQEEVAAALATWVSDSPDGIGRITAARVLLRQRGEPAVAQPLVAALQQAFDAPSGDQAAIAALRSAAQQVQTATGPAWPNRLPSYRPAADLLAQQPELMAQLQRGAVLSPMTQAATALLQQVQQQSGTPPQVRALIGVAGGPLRVPQHLRGAMVALLAGQRACPRCGEFGEQQGHRCPTQESVVLPSIARGNHLTREERNEVYDLAARIRGRTVLELTDPTLHQAASFYTGLGIRPDSQPPRWYEHRLAAAIATASSEIAATPRDVARRAVADSPRATTLSSSDFGRDDADTQRAVVALQRAAHRLRAFPIRQEDHWALDGLLGELAATRGGAPPTPDVLARAQAVVAKYATL